MMNALFFLLLYIKIGSIVGISCKHGKFNETTKKCICNSGWKGTHCNKDIDECDDSENYCVKNNTQHCTNTPGGYNCSCKLGYKGKRCEIFIDSCYPNKCKFGRCVPQVGWYECVCNNDSVKGKHCDIKCPHCDEKNSHCAYDEKHNKTFCRCNKGSHGPLCTQDQDECTLVPDICKNGKCINKDKGAGYKCECFAGWTGSHCDVKIDFCHPNPCKNGTCLSNTANFTCKCDPHYTGRLCDKLNNSCEKVICLNGGKCVNFTYDQYYCKCAPGFNGSHCGHELPCHRLPCKNNGSCENVGNDRYKCYCKPGWTGSDCSKNSSCKVGICKHGGQCVEGSGGTYKCKCKNGYDGKHCEKVVKAKCMNPNCSKHVGKCRRECNTHECDWDGKLCSLGVSPWQNCTASKCWQKFGDGICDEECDNAVCSFDDFDCVGSQKNCSDDQYCRSVFGNGRCDTKCNTPECAFDGSDCDAKPEHKFVPGDLIVTLQSTKDEFEKRKTEFIRSMSKLLHTRVVIEEIIEIDIENDGEHTIVRRAAVGRLNVRMRLDNQKCKRDCFQTTKAAARFIAAKKARGKLDHLPFPVLNVYAKPEKKILSGRISPLWIASCVAVPLLLLGVIAFTRKVVTRLWHPEGDNRFAVNDMRREPLGQEGDEMTNLQRRESVSGGSHVSPSGSCSDSPNSVGDAKRMKVEMVGSLGSSDWLNVKGVLREQADSPGGVVHLPATSVDGSHTESSCGDTDGETNLHVAARLAKTELARQLIEFGVDINARNKSGKTPLHLAVSSLADGVFQLLIRNRACQIDVQDYEGRTALMSACHCCHNMMVDELISNGAKVNLVDSQGKTALHCAAMVDNHKAVLVLLKNGAKVDAQDNKGQTPLFLAARDGAYTTAYVLLANYANRNCADSMDVTPLTISHQRGQKDLVALLSDWTGSPPGMMTSPSRNSPPDLSSPSSGTISPTPCSQYSDIRPKLPTSYGQMPNGNVNSSNNNNNNNPIKPPMKRKRKSTKGTKEKTSIEKNHPSFLNNYPASMNDVYPTPRSSMDKREGGLPELNSAEILEGMNMYPALEQINNLPTNWNSSLMGGVHGPSHGPGHGPGHGPTHAPGHGPGHGHYQFTNSMLQSNNRQFQFPQQQQTYVSHPYDNRLPASTFLTPPSDDNGSPIDQLNVLPSPFLTPSPETWSNSPGNSDNSAC